MRFFRRCLSTGRSSGAVVGVVALLLVGGCSATPDSRLSHVRPADTVVASGTADPRAAPAIMVYRSFAAAAVAGQRHPVDAGRPVPARADLTRLAFDPARSEYEDFDAQLAADHLEFRGDAPTPKLTVTKIDLDAQPWPAVTLTDCRTSPASWLPYDTHDDRAVAMRHPGLQAAGPVEVSMVFRQQRWGVQTVLPTESANCPG